MVGLVCIELIKLLSRPAQLEAHANTFINLALPLIAFSEPNEAEEYPMPQAGAPWNLWSKLEVAEGRELSLAELVQLLEERLGLEISMLSYRSKTIYSSLAPPQRQKAWMPLGVRAALGDALGTPPRGGTLFLQANCYDDDAEEDVEVPTVAYRDAGL